MNYAKIIESLKVISEMCFNTDECEKCPCGNEIGECLLNVDAPNKWQVIEPEEIVRVMK